MLIIETSNLDLSSVFLCSFDISSLCTNVPQAENIQIRSDAFNRSKHPPAPFPRQIFVKLMEMATSSVVFSFDDIMHHQVDGVAWDHPFDHPLPIFCWLLQYESKPFQTTSKPNMYYRYMDDTFVVFSNENECNLFLNNLNSLLFALVLKKNLIWLFLSWTCCLKNLFPSLSPPTTGNLYIHLSIQANGYSEQIIK